MKTLVVSAAVLFAASMMSAQTAPAPAKPADTKVAPATPAPAKPGAKKDEKKKEEEPKIPGVTVNRPNGTFLGLEVVGGQFKLTFYDKKKKPMAIDVTRANARWPNRKTVLPAEFRTVLNPSGPNSLTGSKPVLPPFGFTVFLTLLRGEGDATQAVENYQVPFQG